jgi:hypothetical protein
VINNRCPPEVIIVYRETGDSENKEMIAAEIEKIKSAIKIIGEKTKIANYSPDIAVITVDQKQPL